MLKCVGILFQLPTRLNKINDSLMIGTILGRNFVYTPYCIMLGIYLSGEHILHFATVACMEICTEIICLLILIQCSPDYAYGAGGFPAWGIMPNSVLVFEIEVLSAQ